MDLTKNVGSEQLLSPRRKVLSRLGLAVAASLLVFTALLLHSSFNSPVVSSFFVGFYNVGNVTRIGHENKESNASKTVRIRNQGFGEGNGSVTLSLGTHSEDFKYKVRNESFSSVEEGGMTQKNNHEANGLIPNKTLLGNLNFSRAAITGSLHGRAEAIKEGNSSNTEEANRVSDGDHKVLVVQKVEEKAMEMNDQGNSFGEKKATRSYKNCDIFSGKWVRHNSRPYYRAGSCPYIDKDFDCQRNGRPDDGYLKWKWQPNGCDLPRLNATDFLVRLKGKRLVFVGDSLNRNMWESMVCILRHSIRNKKRVYEISGRSDFKRKGFYAFRFEDYNCSVDFVGAPFLVRSSLFKRNNGSIETLRLDLMDQTTSMYHAAEIMVFNTGHWWTHEKTSRGEDYYQEGNHVYPRLKVVSAYRKALSTWASWIDKNVDSSRTQVFFRGYSVTHFWGGQWNSGGQCHKETDPIADETHLKNYPSKMRAVEHVLQRMKTPITYLNVSRLTDYRKDAHPSIYRKEYHTVEERAAAEGSQDCSHWCLPGVPDTWNELLYASLLKTGNGDWRN